MRRAALAGGEGFGEAFFYQPFFYPFFLGLVYSLHGRVDRRGQARPGGAGRHHLRAGRGPRLTAPRPPQRPGRGRDHGGVRSADVLRGGAAGGRLGRLLVGAAGVAVRGCCGEAVVAPPRGRSAARCGLAVLTRPTFVPFVAPRRYGWPVVLWRAASGRLPSPAWQPRVRVSRWSWCRWPASVCHTTGELHFLPASGGLNLHLGNNPEPCTHPDDPAGPGVARAGDGTAAAGARRAVGGGSRTSAVRCEQFAVSHRRRVCRRLISKSLQVVSSREIPRNLDIYLFRRWSSLLALTVWKVGRFGFPFGVLLPLAWSGWRWRGDV